MSPLTIYVVIPMSLYTCPIYRIPLH